MKEKASLDQFHELHELVTTAMIEKIQSGEYNASDLKAATDWLYKNNITGVAVQGTPLDRLRLVVPDIDPEEVNRRVNGA